jgi:hypothetical protein
LVMVMNVGVMGEASHRPLGLRSLANGQYQRRRT